MLNRKCYMFNREFLKCFIKKNRSTSIDSPSLQYCVELVRKHDHDGFLCNLLLPPNLRAVAFAIRSFNIELSKIQEQTKEQHTGIMRLKFWENGLESVFNDTPINHPVLLELHKAAKRHQLSKLLFKRLVSARLKQLNVSTFKNLTEMENYADLTCSSVLMLLLEAFGLKNVHCDHVASHIGRAQGLSNLIRALPHNLKEKVVLLPMTELMEHNVSEESLLRNSVDPDILSKIIFKIASSANHHLNVANSLDGNVPTKCKPIFLPAVPVRIFLKKLEKCSFYIYEPTLSAKNGLLPFVLIWNKLRKTY